MADQQLNLNINLGEIRYLTHNSVHNWVHNSGIRNDGFNMADWNNNNK